MASFTVNSTNYTNRVVLGEIDTAISMAMDLPTRANWFEVICHGWSDGFALPLVNGQHENCSPEEMASLIQAQPGFTGQTVHLIACKLYCANFAQRLADLLGTAVYAADQEIDLYEQRRGEVWMNLCDNGRWHLVCPAHMR